MNSSSSGRGAAVVTQAPPPLTIRVLYQIHPRIFDGGEQEIAFTVDLYEVVLRSKTNKYSVNAEHLLERLLTVFAKSRHCQGYATPTNRDEFLRELCVLRCLSIGTPLVELDVTQGERRVEFRQTDCVRLVRRYVIAPIYITAKLFVEVRLDIRWNNERATDHVMRQLFDGNGFLFSTDYSICLTTHVSALWWSEQQRNNDAAAAAAASGGNGCIDWIGNGVQIPSSFWSSSNATLRKRAAAATRANGGGGKGSGSGSTTGQQQKSSLFGRLGGSGSSSSSSCATVAANKWCWFDDLYTAVYEIDSKLWKSMYLRKRYFNLTNETYLLSLNVARKSAWDSFDLYNDVYECRQTLQQIAADYCGRNRDERHLDNCVRRLVQNVSSESTSVYRPIITQRPKRPTDKVDVPTRMFDKQLRVSQLLKNVQKYLDGVNLSLRNGGRLHISLPPSFRTFAKHLFDIRLSRFRLMSPVRIGPDSFLPIALCNLKVLFMRVERLDGMSAAAVAASQAAAGTSKKGAAAATAAPAAMGQYNSYKLKANFERSRLLPHVISARLAADQLADSNNYRDDIDYDYDEDRGAAAPFSTTQLLSSSSSSSSSSTMIVTVLLDGYINWRRDESGTTLLGTTTLGSPSAGLLGTARRRIVRLGVGGRGKQGSSDSLLSSSSSSRSATPTRSSPLLQSSSPLQSAATTTLATAFNVFLYFVVDAYHLNEENCRRKLNNNNRLSACTAISIRDKSLYSLMINGVGVRALVKLFKHANDYAKKTIRVGEEETTTTTTTTDRENDRDSDCSSSSTSKAFSDAGGVSAAATATATATTTASSSTALDETYEPIDIDIDVVETNMSDAATGKADARTGAVASLPSPKPRSPPMPPPKPRLSPAEALPSSQPIYEVPRNNGSVNGDTVGGDACSNNSANSGSSNFSGSSGKVLSSLSILRDLTMHYNNLHYIDLLLRQTTSESEGLPFFGRLKSLHENLQQRSTSNQPIPARDLEVFLDLVQSIYRHIPYIMHQLILLGYYSTHEKIEKLL